jgi:hypothetical protein
VATKRFFWNAKCVLGDLTTIYRIKVYVKIGQGRKRLVHILGEDISPFCQLPFPSCLCNSSQLQYPFKCNFDWHACDSCPFRGIQISASSDILFFKKFTSAWPRGNLIKGSIKIICIYFHNWWGILHGVKFKKIL